MRIPQIYCSLLDSFKHKGLRARLIDSVAEKGIQDELVLEAMRNVPRHWFVQSAFGEAAYEDRALPIQSGQTISQPFTVAFQLEQLQLKAGMKVLEIGTGSGYQAAILSEMGMKVYSIEYDAKLFSIAQKRLDEFGYPAELKHGDGSQGWRKHAPYHRIIVAAASPEAPLPLKMQLSIGGKMVIPVGSLDIQEMQLITRLAKNEFQTEFLSRFRFVPLRGRYGFE